MPSLLNSKRKICVNRIVKTIFHARNRETMKPRNHETAKPWTVKPWTRALGLTLVSTGKNT